MPDVWREGYQGRRILERADCAKCGKEVAVNTARHHGTTLRRHRCPHGNRCDWNDCAECKAARAEREKAPA